MIYHKCLSLTMYVSVLLLVTSQSTMLICGASSNERSFGNDTSHVGKIDKDTYHNSALAENPGPPYGDEE